LNDLKSGRWSNSEMMEKFKLQQRKTIQRPYIRTSYTCLEGMMGRKTITR